MFDLHYDLLTYVYMNKDNLYEVKKHCKEIFKNNICGGIFNLFYMSPKEMKKELKIELEEISIIKNLEEVNRLIKDNNLIPSNIKYIYGIEGLDYLDNLNDLDKIYDLGVRSVNIVWNNDNKYGGGAKGDKSQGLTRLGAKLVNKLVEKNIAIDLSHANEKTFYDIVNICDELKSNNKNPIVFASHSNAKTLCNNVRNLSDEQIIRIKKLDGVIGIAGIKPFCIQEERFNKFNNKYQNAYISHIKYVKKILGGTDNLAVSTDDMTYYKTNYYRYFNVFKQENIKKELSKKLIDSGFTEFEAKKILLKNAKNKILQRL